MIDRRLNYGRHLIDKFTKALNPNAVVLDIGAGHGDDLMLAKKNNQDAKLYAIEYYPPYIKELEDKGVTVYSKNLEVDKLPFENESVDLINCNQILEHCKDIWWIFHELSRVLKVDGYLVIGVPNLASLHNRLLLIFGKQPTSIQNDSAHVRGYTKNDMIKLIKRGSGGVYELTGFGGSNFYPFPPPIAKPLAKLLPTMAWGSFYQFKKFEKYNDGFLKYPVENRLETNFYLGK